MNTYPRKCATNFCRGIVLKTHHNKFCRKCQWRRLKEKDPIKYAFLKLKGRARERGHAFHLTFDQYRKFAVETGYDKLKGKTKHSLSIHRKDNDKGYHPDNIEAVTLSLNSRLQWANLPGYLKEEMLEAERQSRLNALASA